MIDDTLNLITTDRTHLLIFFSNISFELKNNNIPLV